jgi:hypothetical protein
MPDTPRGSRPDPMSRQVDRLLARLSGPVAEPVREPSSSRQRASSSYAASQPLVAVGIARAPIEPRRGPGIALWMRALLGVTLAAAMTQWPYPHDCDLPLLGYLGAVAALVLAGGWVALASWTFRSGPVHVLSLILVFWGVVLAAEQTLPRVGYAAERASWRCGAGASVGR